jgi:hypothetical protein
VPARTNPFQQLVRLIQSQIASAQTTVTESRFLADKETRKPVEVDIVVETVVQGVPIRLGFECKNSKRRMSVEWVRSMFAKLDNLEIDKTVLVSSSGFSAEAVRYANAKNILTLTLSQAISAEWSKYLEHLKDLRIGRVEITPIGGSIAFETGVEHAAVPPESRVRFASAEGNFTLRDYVISILRRPDVLPSVFRKWGSSPREHRDDPFEVTMTLVPNEKVQIQVPAGEWLTIKSIAIRTKVSIRGQPLQLTAGSLGNLDVAYARIPNMFSAEPAADEYVVLNLLAKKGILERASVLLPGERAQGDVRHMTIVSQPGEAQPDRPGAPKSGRRDDDRR